MQFKDPASEPWVAASSHRTPDLRIKQLIQGNEDNRNFEFNLVEFFNDDFFSPRHRHNFDQIRIGLEGTTSYGKGKHLKPRMVGYYPEGTFYGPQTLPKSPSLQGIIQFGGASGAGYYNYRSLDVGTAELRELGEFRKGFFYPHDGSAKDNAKPRDAYEAVWEHITGRKLVYPTPRFDEAVYMHVDGFEWLPSESEEGVWLKTLAVFGEHGTRLTMVRISKDETHMLLNEGPTPLIVLVVAGSVSVGTFSGGHYSAMTLSSGDRVPVSAVENTELICVQLPDVNAG